MRICPYPFFEATPPGAAPGPPVKTGARVRRFRGCNYPREVRSSTSQRSSAFRHRSSPTHAFGISLALVSFLISIFFRAVSARPPSSRCRHHRHPRCHQQPTDHPQLLYAGATPPASSPDTCALSIPTWQYYYSFALSLPFCPALCSSSLFPPPAQQCCPPAHTSASASTPPRYPCHRTCTNGSRHGSL